MKTDYSIIYSIRWDNLANESYLYGSSIIFEPDRTVRFTNHLMPPGQIIRKWESSVNYQAKRHEPQLPILEEGERYEIRLYASFQPDESVQLRIRFFNRQGEEEGKVIIDDMMDEFVCPHGASDYELELINSGTEELVFHHIEIQKKSQSDKNVRIVSRKEPIYVIILEPTGSSYIFPEERILNRYKNRVILTCEGADAIDLNSCVTDKMPEGIGPKDIAVIGYGTDSNKSALRYAERIGMGVKVYTYDSHFEDQKTGIDHTAHRNETDRKKAAQCPLTAPLCDKTARLNNLSDLSFTKSKYMIPYTAIQPDLYNLSSGSDIYGKDNGV